MYRITSSVNKYHAPGGGAIEIVVRKILQLEGTISGNGRRSNFEYQGGGSGGSVIVIGDTIEGYGRIQVPVEMATVRLLCHMHLRRRTLPITNL